MRLRRFNFHWIDIIDFNHHPHTISLHYYTPHHNRPLYPFCSTWPSSSPSPLLWTCGATEWEINKTDKCRKNYTHSDLFTRDESCPDYWPRRRLWTRQKSTELLWNFYNFHIKLSHSLPMYEAFLWNSLSLARHGAPRHPSPFTT